MNSNTTKKTSPQPTIANACPAPRAVRKTKTTGTKQETPQKPFNLQTVGKLFCQKRSEKPYEPTHAIKPASN